MLRRKSKRFSIIFLKKLAVFRALSLVATLELATVELMADSSQCGRSALFPSFDLTEVVDLKNAAANASLPEIGLNAAGKDNGKSVEILSDLVLSLDQKRINLMEVAQPESLVALKRSILYSMRSTLTKEALSKLNDAGEKDVIKWFKALRQTTLLIQLQNGSLEKSPHLIPFIFSNAKAVYGIHEKLLNGHIPQEDVLSQLKVSREGLAKVIETNERLKELVLRSLPLNTLMDGVVSVDRVTGKKRINWLSMVADVLNTFALCAIGAQILIQGGKLAGTSLAVGNRVLAAEARIGSVLVPVAGLSAYDQYQAGNKEFATIYGAMAIMGGIGVFVSSASPKISRMPKDAAFEPAALTKQQGKAPIKMVDNAANDLGLAGTADEVTIPRQVSAKEITTPANKGGVDKPLLPVSSGAVKEPEVLSSNSGGFQAHKSKIIDVYAGSNEWYSYDPSPEFIKAVPTKWKTNRALNQMLDRQDEFIEVAVWAATETNIPYKIVEQHGKRILQLSKNISPQEKTAFETRLAQMLTMDVSNHSAAVRARANPIRTGVTRDEAASARKSGFASREELKETLNDPSLLSTYGKVWNSEGAANLLAFDEKTGFGFISLYEAHLNNHNTGPKLYPQGYYNSATSNVLREAVKQPMIPLETPNKVWVVFFWQEYQLSNVGGGSKYKFAVFKTKADAIKFTETHRQIYIDRNNTAVAPGLKAITDQ